MSVFHPVWTLGSYLLPFLFVLGLVVFFHELGHFIVGRMCGIKADVFSMGFGPEIAHFIDRYGTRWRLAALPLGGYVRFHGDANGASETDFEAAAAMPESERAVSFFAQKVWKRAAVVVAGPLANFVLALVIFTGLFYFKGREILIPRVDQVIAGSRAAVAGFHKGDLVVSINGAKIDNFLDMQRIVSTSAGVKLHFVVQRDGKPLEIDATPQLKESKTALGAARIGVLGVTAGGAPTDWRLQTYSLPRAAVEAGRETWFVVARTGDYIAGVAEGRQSAKGLSGPIRIAQVSGQVAKAGIWPLFSLAAILSISIGLLNLLPIPLLDGGHLLYYAFEAARGKALTPRAQEFGFRVGLAFVLTLMLVATYNDIAHITRQWFKLG